MVITAVNNVSFRGNYNNLNFEGKKKQRPEHEPRHSSSMLKAIPLATMIAMSPLNAPSTNFSINDDPEKIIEIHEVDEGDKLTNIRLISTDNDDSTIEKFSLEVFSDRKGESFDADLNQKVATKRSVIDCVDVDTLKLKDVTIDYFNVDKVDKRKYYYVVGDITRFESAPKATDGSGKVYGKNKSYKGQAYEYEVSKDLYDYLKSITQGIVPETKKVIEKQVGFTLE